MSKYPTHPIQRAQDIPSYGKFRDFGDNRYGAELIGRGNLPAGLKPRRATVHGNTSTVIGLCDFNSTLVSSANGYEGIFLSVNALKRIGNDRVEQHRKRRKRGYNRAVQICLGADGYTGGKAAGV